LTQGELAARAGVSRQLVGAAESGRNLPRVDAALALATALGVEVAELFGTALPPADVVTGDVPPEGSLVRAGQIGDRVVTISVGIGAEGWDAADGIVEQGALAPFIRRTTGIVVAGCEPGLEVLEHILRESARRALAVPTSSAAAIAALDHERVHAAVVHGPAGTVGGRVAGRSVDRFRLTGWRVGIAAPVDAAADWWRDALCGAVPVVQREAGAGVQRTFEEVAGTDVPGPRVTTHVAAARRAALTGMAAVTIEPAAIAVGASFHPLDVHEAELWVDRTWMTDRVVGDALDVITGRRFQRRLEAVGGYDLAGCGDRIP
jgi:DNA-binding XRE family transcriptional regulator/molybdate-binding protein